jgi:hypothetical protein
MRIEYGFTDLVLTSPAGLPAFRQVLKAAQLRAAFGPSLKTLPEADIFTTATALLALGKCDCEAVSAYRDDPGFPRLLGLKRLPSAEILRQRLDQAPAEGDAQLAEANVRMLEAHATPLAGKHGLVPLDFDSTPMDNSGTHREGVSWTYQGFDGYHPLFCYLGERGYLLAQQLRPGSQHPQNEFIPFFKQALAWACRLSDGPLLARLDGAHDAEETLAACLDEAIDFILRYNPRGRDAEKVWRSLGENPVHFASGPGYFTAVSEERRPLAEGCSVRLICLVTRKTADRQQLLLRPEYEIEGFWTSLDLPVEDVVALYPSHATCEQFHSELKSDIGLERFPSGKFATHQHMLSCAQLAFNALRLLDERMKANRPFLPKRLRELEPGALPPEDRHANPDVPRRRAHRARPRTHPQARPPHCKQSVAAGRAARQPGLKPAQHPIR